MTPSERTIAEDVCADLQHDLAKYLRLPLAMLPRDANAEALREALRTALRQTRTGPRGVRGARTIWAELAAEAPAALRSLAPWAPLEAAVTRALAWDQVVDRPEATLDRTTVEADLTAVGTAARDLAAALDQTGAA